METIIINPDQAYDQHAIYLKQLFVGYKNKVSLFSQDKLYQLPTDEKITIKLTNDVIARMRNRNGDELRYEVIDKDKVFGEGGYSKIYKIKCTLAIEGETVIAKRKKQRLVKVQEHRKNDLSSLFREFDLTRRAGNLHMKIPVVQTAGEQFHISYCVMKKINGMDCYDYLNKLADGKLYVTTEDRLKISVGMIKLLAELHAKNIIHRDIKPENIMIDPDSLELNLIDYGLSKTSDKDDKKEKVGTYGYSPIECYTGDGTNEKTDLYSIAIVIGILWGAYQPESTALGTLNYKFPEIFTMRGIDLAKDEKNRILSMLKRMTANSRDDRCRVDESLKEFEDIYKSYQQRKLLERFEKQSYHHLALRGFMLKGLYPKKPIVYDEIKSSVPRRSL